MDEQSKIHVITNGSICVLPVMKRFLETSNFLFSGPAFLRGWWLLHEPPADCLERLAKADAIYISHLHSGKSKIHAQNWNRAGPVIR